MVTVADGSVAVIAGWRVEEVRGSDVCAIEDDPFPDTATRLCCGRCAE